MNSGNSPSCPDSSSEQWQVDSCLRYSQALTDYSAGLFSFSDIKDCGLENIMKKNDFQEEILEKIQDQAASLQDVVDKAEKKLERAQRKAIDKLAYFLHYP